jgi:hypothetical protein
MANDKPTYVTSFCNFPHYVETGRPIGHECYIIPPRCIKAERDLSDWDEILAIWKPFYDNKGPTVVGRNSK